MANRYARGVNALGICGKCGLHDYLRNLVFDGYIPNLRVHPECRDEKHPQDRLVPLTDAVALFRPAPEQANATPGTLTALRTGPQVQLAWTPTITIGPRIESYGVYRSVNGAGETQINSQVVVYDFDMTVLTQPDSYLDAPVISGNTYVYRVLALDSYGHGINTNTVSVVVP